MGDRVKHMLLAILSCVTAIATATASGASFNCDEPGLTSIEDRICADQNLSGQDENLSDEYKRLRNLSSKPEREKLKKDQRDWLDNVRDKCSDDACLTAAYLKRLDVLADRINDKRLASYTPEFLAELARQTGVSEDDLKSTLPDCGGGSRFGLQMCAFADFVQADVKMRKELAKRLASLSRECGRRLQLAQNAWTKSIKEECRVSSDDENMPGDQKSCEAAETEKRYTYLKSVASCDAQGIISRGAH
jgi:uncharacterized protein